MLGISVFSVFFNFKSYISSRLSERSNAAILASIFRNTLILCIIYLILSAAFLFLTIIRKNKAQGKFFFIAVIVIFTLVMVISLLLYGGFLTELCWLYLLPYTFLIVGSIVQMAYNPKPSVMNSQYITQVVIKDKPPDNCPNCGAAITQGKFCPFCGTRIND